jgi:hypothetical protein
MKQNSFSILLLFVFSVILVSCVNDNVEGRTITRTEAGNTLIVAPEFSAVILSKKNLENRPILGFDQYWVPRVKQILNLEPNLEPFIDQTDSHFNSGHAPDKEKLPEYFRQYFGVFYDEKPVIMGQFICPALGREHDLTNDLFIVFGGGDCIFYVVFDPDSSVFISFAVGSAK